MELIEGNTYRIKGTDNCHVFQEGTLVRLDKVRPLTLVNGKPQAEVTSLNLEKNFDQMVDQADLEPVEG